MIKSYKVLADAYRSILEKEDMNLEDKDEILRKIRVYDHMSQLGKEDIEILYQSGMFNDLVRRDVSRILREAHIDRDLFAAVYRRMEIMWN